MNFSTQFQHYRRGCYLVNVIHEVEMKTQKSKCFDFGGQSRNEKSKWSK